MALKRSDRLVASTSRDDPFSKMSCQDKSQHWSTEKHLVSTRQNSSAGAFHPPGWSTASVGQGTDILWAAGRPSVTRGKPWAWRQRGGTPPRDPRPGWAQRFQPTATEPPEQVNTDLQQTSCLHVWLLSRKGRHCYISTLWTIFIISHMVSIFFSCQVYKHNTNLTIKM